jgi:predicted extracellular nuclease
MLFSAALVGLASLAPQAQVGVTPISLSALDVAYTQDFDTLANSGTSSTVPAGWALLEAGTNANTTYTAGTGSGNAGDTYSFGATGSTERAFGGLQSGTLIPTIGAAFTNATGTTVTQLAIAYTGEQWRLGATGRVDRLDFQYSLDATGLSGGTWVDVDGLDFTGPVTVGTVGALDGNAPANRTPVTFTITGLSLAPGATFWIRWTDFNATGADDGLAVDHFSITPEAPAGPTDPTGTGAADPASVLPNGTTLLTVDVTPGTNPPSTGLAVAADLSAIGGRPAQAFFDDGTNGDVTPGDNVFSYLATVGAGTSPGPKSLPATITDAQARTGSATIALTVQGPPAISLTASGVAYTQNFDTLATTGINNTALPTGWNLSEAGGGARDNEQYAADTGSSNTGDTYSYGSAGSPERAFGGLQSGTLIPTIGAAFTNNTGATITAIEVAYIGEQWRLGTAGREDRLDFQYSTNATSLTSGTWTDVNTLDFSSPNTTAAVGALDGNAAGNRTEIGDIIGGLAIPPGATFWIRWTDFNAAGADDGLAVDEFSLTPNPRPRVVISQVYGGGGNAGATLRRDFIELFNRGATPADLTGWSVQYNSAAGTGTWQKTDLTSVVLQPGQYYLVAEAAGAGGTVDLPPPDADGSIAMSATAGKVALLSTQLAASGTCPAGNVIDLVGYGTTATCSETAPTATLSNTTAALRNVGGCADTDNNAADFSVGAPDPRNTSASLNPCGGGTAPSGTGEATPNPVFPTESVLFTVAVTPGSSPPSTGLTVTANLTAIGGSAAQPFFDDGTNGDVTPDDNVFSFATTVPAPTPLGDKAIPVILADAQGRSRAITIDLTVATPPACTTTETIAGIQGSGAVSPLTGQTVTTEGIVFAVRSNGFNIQMAVGDGDPATSDGILVFTSSVPPSPVAVGNHVCVTGTVVEFVPAADPFQPPLTELGGPITVTRLSSGNPLPAPVDITAAMTTGSAADVVARLEALEGMRVRVESLTVVGPTLRSGGINENAATLVSSGVFYGVVSGVPRPFREAGVDVVEPLLECAAGANCAIPRYDGNPERLRIVSVGLGGPSLEVTAGATVTNLVGPLDFGFRTYSILPEPGAVVSNLADIRPAPAPLADELTVASFNMLRFFDNLDDPDFPIPGTGGSEPILTAAAWERRLTKASATIRQVLHTPDVLGLVEIENQATVDALAARLNADAVLAGAPNPGYQGVLVDGNDIGGIDVAFLWKTGRFSSVLVEQFGKTDTFTNPNTGGQETLNDRPPLVLHAQATRSNGEPFPFIVIVNHLRSLNSLTSTAPNPTNPNNCLPGALCTEGARVRAKRRAQAEYLAQLIADLQAATPGARILSVGDFNAFDVSDGYVDVMGTVKGTPAPPEQVVVASPDLVNPDQTNLQVLLPPGERYSYVFDGNAQTLDHALANAAMLPWISRFAYGRSNADFPETDFNGATAKRSSDHDASVTYVALGVQRLVGHIVGSTGHGATVDLQITNTGGGMAHDVVLDQIVFRTLAGTGTVSLQSPLPIAIGRLAPGESRTVTLALNVGPNVTRFSMTENGALTSSAGARLSFSMVQMVVP